MSGNFFCYNNKLTTLEGGPQSVGGIFMCSHNKLTTLEGGPQSVGLDFICAGNELTTLQGAPQYVDSFNCSRNKLTTLEYAPPISVHDFICYNNKLTTLKGAPQSVSGYFSCNKNNLTTLEYAPISINGIFDCSENNLTTLEYAPQSVDKFVCSSNKDLKSLNYISKYIHSKKVNFRDTAVYEIFKLLDNFSLDMIRYVNDLNVIVIAPNSNILYNLKTWLSDKRILTDGITIKTAFVINLSIYLEITTLPNYNSQSVLYDCLTLLKTLMNNDNMNINEPINISNLKVEIDKVDGVQTVVNLSFENKYGGDYSNVRYDISSATLNNILYPAKTPSVFEVKFPNVDITGKVI